MTKIIHDHSAMKSSPLCAAGVAEQGHSGNDILLGLRKKKTQGCTAGFELQLEQK